MRGRFVATGHFGPWPMESVRRAHGFESRTVHVTTAGRGRQQPQRYGLYDVPRTLDQARIGPL